MLIACLNNLEAVPRPATRIQAFKYFLRVTIEPVVRQIIQPMVRSWYYIPLARLATYLQMYC